MEGGFLPARLGGERSRGPQTAIGGSYEETYQPMVANIISAKNETKRKEKVKTDVDH